MKKYLVGGAVRDSLMGVESNDRDYVVVGATEQDMLNLGYKKVGADFPVFLDENGDQWALARKERKTGPGYHGFEVTFDPSVTIEDDLFRRDLTINAMAKDLETGEIIDPYHGQFDLQYKLLRHVSDAFVEDPLRVIRLARFYARWTDFDIVFSTICMAQDIVSSGAMNELADERFYAEMEKMFVQAKEASRFFSALYAFDFKKIEFFDDLLNDPDIDRIRNIANSAHKFMSAEDAVVSFIALVQDNAVQESPAIPTRVKKLSKAVTSLRKTIPTVNSVFKLMERVKGFKPDSPTMNDLLKAMLVYQAAGYNFPVRHVELAEAFSAVSSVTAEKYLHLSGEKIGRAMDKERLEKLSAIFDK